MSAQSESFRHHYAPDQIRPWECGGPQPAIAAVADLVRGRVLDIGCGTGEHALFFAARGHSVWGFDGAPEAIEIANQKAYDRGVAAKFGIADALDDSWNWLTWGTIIDSSLFHCFGSDEERARYVANLARAIVPGGLLLLLCYADFNQSGIGPRHITKDEIRNAFAGWRIDAIFGTEIKLHPTLQGIGPAGAWLAIIRAPTK